MVAAPWPALLARRPGGTPPQAAQAGWPRGRYGTWPAEVGVAEPRESRCGLEARVKRLRWKRPSPRPWRRATVGVWVCGRGAERGWV